MNGKRYFRKILKSNFSDIDECARNLSRCDENAECTNTDGSYNCSCNNGYEGDGFNCNGTCPDSMNTCDWNTNN